MRDLVFGLMFGFIIGIGVMKLWHHDTYISPGDANERIKGASELSCMSGRIATIKYIFTKEKKPGNCLETSREMLNIYGVK